MSLAALSCNTHACWLSESVATNQYEARPSCGLVHLVNAERHSQNCCSTFANNSSRLFCCMSLNMLRKPLLREGVRLCCKPMWDIHSGSSFTTASGGTPLSPCTSNAASPCSCHQLGTLCKDPRPAHLNLKNERCCTFVRAESESALQVRLPPASTCPTTQT